MLRSIFLGLALVASACTQEAGLQIAPEPVGQQPGKTMVLFEFVNPLDLKMTPKQSRIFERIKNAESSLDVVLVKASLSVLDAAPETIEVAVSPTSRLKVRDYKIAREGQGRELTWKGEGRDSVQLLFSRDSVHGLVYANNQIYAVEPVGEGYQALVHVDQTKFRNK